MSYRITGLPAQPFESLFGLPDAELAALGVQRHTADAKPGYPDRIALREAEPGETVLLLNYEHQPGESPYRSRHAIFVIEGERQRFDAVGQIPEVLRPRLLSLRAFDAAHEMVDADLVDGREVEGLIERLLANQQTEYIHVHYAKRGCYAARVERVADA